MPSSSPQPIFESSPPISSHDGGGGVHKKSKFTYKHLAQLSTSSVSCPLRVIAHVDLDAFYAQCEMVRLGVGEEVPLAVRQWQGLIALNYPAREFGLNRHITVPEALKLCPQLKLVHVATWREGDAKWAYRDGTEDGTGEVDIRTNKVALDYYRGESRKILGVVKEVLEAGTKVEKASVDEVFMDLSAMVWGRLRERFPEVLGGGVPYDDLSERLPMPDVTALDWKADALVDLDDGLTENDDPDWDDIAILIGSEIVREVRATVKEKLNYTCSGGIARNKMLAKLGSAHKKPNQQTVIRNRAVQQFLSDFKFPKIRGLGGKLGDQITSAFGTDTVKDLLPISIEQFKHKLGDDTGTWIYQIIRGNDNSEVNSRTQIKSMLSAKSFRPSINSLEQAHRWLRIFVADIYSRLVDEGVLENKRRPKTMNLHHRTGGQTKSRQAPIPLGKNIEEAGLFELAKTLLSQIMLEGRGWPCENLSLSVGGFEDGVSGNMGIGAFLVKGDEAKAMNSKSNAGEGAHDRPEKRRRIDTPGIQKFFLKTETTEDDHDEDFGAQHLPDPSAEEDDAEASHEATMTGENEANNIQNHDTPLTGSSALQQKHADFSCSLCNLSMQSAEELQSHQDWHFAKELQEQDRVSVPQQSKTSTLSSRKKPSTNNKKKTGQNKSEKGQKKLTFG